MFKLLSILLVLIAITLTTWLVVQNDGLVVIEWLDYYIETSFIFTVLTVFFFLTIFALIFNFFNYLRRLPSEISDKLIEIKSRQNLLYLIDGFNALALEDLNQAKSINNKLLAVPQDENFRLIAPIVSILAVQIYEASGETMEAEKHYKTMLESDKLKFMGLKGLLCIKHKQELYSEALIYGEQAYNINNKCITIISLLLDIYEKLALWDKAKDIMKLVEKYNQLKPELLEAKYENIYVSHAQQLTTSGEFEQAITELKKFNKKYPLNLKAIFLLAKLYHENNKSKQAIKLLEEAWQLNPSYEIILLILNIYNDESTAKKIDKLEYLIKLKPQYYEGYVVLAEFLIKENNLEKAKTVIENFLATHPITPDIAKTMAKIQTRLSAKPTEIYKWLESI